MYRNLPAADMLHLTRSLNRRFDQGYARARLNELGIPLNRKAGRLSGVFGEFDFPALAAKSRSAVRSA